MNVQRFTCQEALKVLSNGDFQDFLYSNILISECLRLYLLIPGWHSYNFLVTLYSFPFASTLKFNRLSAMFAIDLTNSQQWH